MPDEKRQLTLDLLAKNNMSKGTKEAADDLDKLGRKAAEADKKAQALSKATEELTNKAGKLDHGLDSTKGRISGLNKEIDVTKVELGKLGALFAEAGSASERLDISKAIRRTENDLRRLNKSKSLL